MGFGIPLSGVDIVKLLEGMAAGTRLSHTKLDDILAASHHARTVIADLSPITLANLVAAVCSETEAAGLITTHDGLASPHSAAGFAKLAIVETEVFNGTSPTAWTDLNLSSVVGANKAWVILKLYNASAGEGNTAGFRANGETEFTDWDSHKSFSNVSIGIQGYSLALIHTDASGIVEWNCQSDWPTVIDVVAYIK